MLFFLSLLAFTSLLILCKSAFRLRFSLKRRGLADFFDYALLFPLLRVLCSAYVRYCIA